MSFDGHPYVCGAIGNVDPAEVSRLTEAGPATRNLVDGELLRIHCHGPVEVKRHESGVRLRWGGVLDTDRGDWSNDGENLLCASAFVDQGKASLQTDVLGLQPLYRKVSGEGFLFSTRIEPLVLSHTGKVHTDWSAWAQILLLRAPLAFHTPFEEVRRFEAGETLTIASGSLEIRKVLPSWLEPAPGQASVQDVAAAVHAAMPRARVLARPPAVTLSGGWDSRLLAAIAAKTYRRRVSAWTTAQDNGKEHDLDFAPAVAETLRLRHRTVLPPWPEWPSEAAEARERFEFQTPLHTWLVPVAREVRRHESAVLDGLAGGVLINGTFVGPRELDEPTWEKRVNRLFVRLSGRRHAAGTHPTSQWREAESEAKWAFLREAAAFKDLPNSLAITVLFVRTARSIALSPMGLFGPEVRVFLPFLAPEVLAATLSVPPEEKPGGGLYRPLLAAVLPAIVELPSTNDQGLQPSSKPRRQTDYEAVQWMARQVIGDPLVSRLANSEFLDGCVDMSNPPHQEWIRDWHQLLLRLSVLAHWRQHHASVLRAWDTAF